MVDAAPETAAPETAASETAPETPADRLPTRELSDPRALRALAHPVRVRLLEELILGGPATATELADRVSESPANCSWHLRALARYGFVEEAGGGRGRQRPWRIVPQGHRWGDGEPDAELALAGDAAAQVVFAREYQAMLAWHPTRYQDSPEWRAAAFVGQSIGWLTAAELTEASREITAIWGRYTLRVADPSSRPPGSRPVRFVAWGYPARRSSTPPGQLPA